MTDVYGPFSLEVTAREIKEAIALGYKGFALTVDGVYLGKRERDLRLAMAESGDDDEELTGGLSTGISYVNAHSNSATTSSGSQLTLPYDRPVYRKFSWTSA